ncbi:SHQ1-domain-containing protein [Fomitiporia mediterranea MF3/22]|uniref:SHQ1-domain-containing protein n=1 Tax=Fomitiporia mediterranea (strain MF3/22) TaxID=694068 RepID=UPI0004408EED|nr:SHQ1-domain-containing protein [Fomitiporia mediterranea MF3/22]EJD05971.1 SHQ1-domain-containing protein [Fomitiporia mediterranea MF3/22]
MITPRFSCSQTADAVTIRIHAPAIRASDVEIHVDETLFSVHINPYFLRLAFPAPVVEDDASSAVYDPTSGYLTVSLTKAMPGEHFKDLDVLAKLLAPPKRDEPAPHPIIEVISSQDAGTEEHVSDDDISEVTRDLSLDQREVLEAVENDWHLPQQVPETAVPSSVSLSTERRYGFLDAYTGYFKHVGHTENEVNELGLDAESLSLEERRARRVKHEDEKWDEEYYMADYVDEENIREHIVYKPPADASCSPNLPDPVVFTEQENMEMLRLPRKEYLATSQQTHNLYLTLLTILFSYAYDARTTQSDPTPESAWTICSLTPAFSALDPPPYAFQTTTPLRFTQRDLQDALIPSLRRSLAFPLYRSFALAEKCLEDVSVVLQHGRRAVLRTLLETKRILDMHEVYYVYSKIWVDDFCQWVASDVSEEILKALGQTLASTRIEKQSLGWDIPALEAAALQELEQPREPDSDDESDPGGPNPLSPDNSGEEENGITEEDHPSSSSSSAASTLSSSSMSDSAEGSESESDASDASDVKSSR